MTSMFLGTLRLLLSFLPAPIQVVIFAIFGVILLFLVFKLIATVLNAIPFL